MVEMLGVLAIIGVLTIVGFVGYQYAITKNKANDTVDELNKRYTVYVVQAERGGLVDGAPLLSNDFGDTTRLGYPAQARLLDKANRVFEITLNDVPVKVCKQILNDYGNVPYEVTVGDADASYEGDVAICGTEANELIRMTFIYDPYNTGVPGGVPPDEGDTCRSCSGWSDCNMMEDCVNGCCVMPECTGDGDCTGGQVCDSGTCVDKCRGATPIEYNDVCYACDTDVVLPVSAEECAKCSAERVFRDNQCSLACDGFETYLTNPRCYPCDLATGIGAVYQSECDKCPQRFHVPSNGTDLCMNCEGIRAYETSAEQCDRCRDLRYLDKTMCRALCPAGQFGDRSLDLKCRDCDTTEISMVNIPFSECNKCPQRIAHSVNLETCDLCSRFTGAASLETTPEQCSKCPGMEMFYNGTTNKCYLKCDGFRHVSGTCLTCEETIGYQASAEECHKCPRFLVGSSDCYPCSHSYGISPVSQAECDLCPDRFQSGTSCYPCSVANSVASTQEQCEKCPNRNFYKDSCQPYCNGFISDGGCKSCDDPTTYVMTTIEQCNRCPGRFFNDYGACSLCTDTGNLPSTQSECSKCPGREWIGGKCYFPICNGFRNNSNTCYPCDSTSGPVSTKEHCDRCPNRRFNATYNSCELP